MLSLLGLKDIALKMKIALKKYVLACLLVGFLLPYASQALSLDKNKKKRLDVRILVDVSTKMKLHDPDHYRKSSLTLFTKLLPSKTTAGIWMYDGMVTELMPVSKVGLSWKSLAEKSFKKIHSKGQFSNLEKALAVASLDWVEKDDKSNRHIVLITDGLINISDRKGANIASKNRVLNYQLNRLKELGVSVHSIGLSEKAEVSLLEELSAGTGGWYDRVKNSGHLERTLFRVNRRLVQKNSVPILSNKFHIDGTVREFTAVVFRKKKFSIIQLDDPEGMDFGRQNYRDGVNWFRAKNYDIVTVSNPLEGDWQIIASADPGNEILVTTKLQMIMDELPKEIPSGQSTRIRSLMVEKGKLIHNGNFLDAIQLSLQLKDKEGEIYKHDMQRDMITGGYYFADVGEDLIPGTYELTVKAKGNTFERIDTALLNVGPRIVPKSVTVPADFKTVLLDSGIEIPKDKLYDPKILIEFEAELDALKNVEQVVEIEPEEESNWLMTSITLLLLNVLFAAVAFFGFKFYKKKVISSDDALISKLAI